MFEYEHLTSLSYYLYDIFCCRNIVGFLYPLYKSIQSIETGAPDGTDCTDWLVYWVIYGFFQVIESFEAVLLWWVPFYYPLKLAFLLWCMLPQYKVCTIAE